MARDGTLNSLEIGTMISRNTVKSKASSVHPNQPAHQASHWSLVGSFHQGMSFVVSAMVAMVHTSTRVGNRTTPAGQWRRWASGRWLDPAWPLGRLRCAEPWHVALHEKRRPLLLLLRGLAPGTGSWGNPARVWCHATGAMAGVSVERGATSSRSRPKWPKCGPIQVGPAGPIRDCRERRPPRHEVGYTAGWVAMRKEACMKRI